jgi:hypothetical protein
VNDDAPVEKQAERHAFDELWRRYNALGAAITRRDWDRTEFHLGRVKKGIQAVERAEIGAEPLSEPFGFYQYLRDKRQGRR